MASDVRPKPRRENRQAKARIRRRGRGAQEFVALMFTLALIRSQREGNKIPRRIPEMPKTGVPSPDLLATCLTWLASRSAQMTTTGHLRLAQPKVKALE
jgi:hypothetical protein